MYGQVMSPIPSLEAPQAEPTGIDADIEADIDLADFAQLDRKSTRLNSSH